ncbi:Uma2 family endonuclease [Cyanobacterium aponinum FACHB-4101]|uniref:Uma2 family endonuclease n=1 Tax=Cyanobacterium aponinum TaxID=379064 RepID=UPI001680FD17|nr:Uma2 family endonuclease [Cyanobacterium aponinum]MBD2394953.1 Uma2 family endonuclease [Cyanobacterium aponinum FACHB-4101]
MNTIPPLENGDRLNRIEFEKRTQTIAEHIKTELINGVVYMAAALKYEGHGLPHSYIMGWLAFYMANTPGVELADNATVRLDLDNQPQPDALLRIKKGGQSKVSKDDYIEGAPELIVEIAGSSASYDLYDKLQVYRRHGVREYIVWQVYEKKIDWFYWNEGKYLTFDPDSSGLIESKVFPGLVLAVNSLLNYNLADVLSVLQKYLNTGKHLEFIKNLAL